MHTLRIHLLTTAEHPGSATATTLAHMPELQVAIKNITSAQPDLAEVDVDLEGTDVGIWCVANSQSQVEWYLTKWLRQAAGLPPACSKNWSTPNFAALLLRVSYYIAYRCL